MRLAVLALLACLSLAAPTSAGVRVYSLSGDASSFFPTDGTLYWPSSVQGRAAILDSDQAAPVLIDLEVEIDWLWVVGPGVTGVPGSTVALEFHQRIGPEPGQVGTGSVSSAIEWGVLGSWTQTGYTACNTFCPGGCGGASACIPFVGFEGTGPLPELASDEFDTGPWSFAADATSFSAPALEILNLVGGAVTEHVRWNGALVPADVPALPFIGLAGLVAVLVGLGARGLGRTRVGR